ncbi:MAG: branched-chain amino acid aminotransferase [Bacteroidetes bacterium]|nr:MAG: branched-chain amino acid aminotransferase [Bacteroidota bacterium]
MEQCLHSYFIANGDVKSTCDFIPTYFEAEGYVYEVIRVIGRFPAFLDEHLERLTTSCELSSIKLPVKIDTIRQQISVLININKILDGNIKLMVSSKQTGLPFYLALWFIPVFYPASHLYKTGVRVALLEMERNTPQIKMHRPEYKNAIAKAFKLRDAYELLLVHQNKITEGSKSNVFFIQNGAVFTAPDNLVLAGITRNKIIEICEKLFIPVHLEAIDVESIRSMDGAFLTGTSPKVLPVSEIFEQATFKPDNPIIQRIIVAYDKLLDQNQRNIEG